MAHRGLVATVAEELWPSRYKASAFEANCAYLPRQRARSPVCGDDASCPVPSNCGHGRPSSLPLAPAAQVLRAHAHARACGLALHRYRPDGRSS